LAQKSLRYGILKRTKGSPVQHLNQEGTMSANENDLPPQTDYRVLQCPYCPIQITEHDEDDPDKAMQDHINWHFNGDQKLDW